MRNVLVRKKSPLYHVWRNMRMYCGLARGAERKRKYYAGVTVCAEWLDFAAFERWCVCAGYRRGLNLVRKDKGGDFCPGNCVFVTRAVANGMRRCVRRMRDGRSARDVIGRDGLGRDRAYANRVARRLFEGGMSVEDAVYAGTYRWWETRRARAEVAR